MAISRMNMERQMRNMGGIMGLEEPRQGYFLGKIVRKAKKAVKKVVKSPLGKAAILGAGLYGLGGGFGAGFNKGLLKTRLLSPFGKFLPTGKFDYSGNRIPDDQIMKYEHLILNDDTATMPSEEDVNAKIAEIDIDVQRKMEYGSIGDQLDKLYHDIDNGKLDETGEWFKSIKKVKDDNHKG